MWHGCILQIFIEKDKGGFSYFSLNFGWYSIQLDIEGYKHGGGDRGTVGGLGIYLMDKICWKLFVDGP